jgi:bacillithiol biosynthesis cysteine-adding enzyme BshC
MEYNKISYFNKIFLDYIYQYDKLSAYYNGDYRINENFQNILNQKSDSYLRNKEFDRNSVADILRDQNKYFNSSQKTFDNIELLRESNTFAVVTGQQTGILTGNFYTILKAINSIQLSLNLNIQFPDYNFVPVFWLEADDHDFLEVNNVNILSKDNIIQNLKYFPGNIEQEKYLKPVFEIDLDDYIVKFIEELKLYLPETDFSGILFDYISRSYKSGINIVTAFARFLNYLLKDKGLIFCNPTDKEIKKLLAPLFLKELITFPSSCELVIDTSAKLELEYEPQVKPKPINLFFSNNSSRYLIEPGTDSIFGLKNSRKKFEKNELFEILDTNPEYFSGNVILRPVCQDYLLPTIAYVGGPSEVAYFAQLKKVYEFFDVTMPIIFPRISVTLLEFKVSSFIEKFDLNFEDFLDYKTVRLKLLEKLDVINIENLFNKYKDEFRSLNYTAEKQLEMIDKNLINNFRNKSEKFIETIEVIKSKFLESQLKQNEAAMNKLKSISELIFPEDNMQERFYNISYYLNKYGIQFIDYLISKINIYSFEHQIVDVNFQRLNTSAEQKQ